MAGDSKGAKNERYNVSSRKKDVRTTNIEAAKAVADAVRTSLGPRGMDKMVSSMPDSTWARSSESNRETRSTVAPAPQFSASR